MGGVGAITAEGRNTEPNRDCTKELLWTGCDRGARLRPAYVRGCVTDYWQSCPRTEGSRYMYECSE